MDIARFRGHYSFFEIYMPNAHCLVPRGSWTHSRVGGREGDRIRKAVENSNIFFWFQSSVFDYSGFFVRSGHRLFFYVTLRVNTTLSCVFLCCFLRRPNPLSFPVCVISSSIFLPFLCVSFLTLFYGSCLASSHEECQVYRTKQLSCISTLSLFFSLTFTRLLSLYLFPNSLRSLLLTHLLTSPFRPIILVSSPSETYDQAYLLFLYHLVFFFLPFLLFLLFLSSPSLWYSLFSTLPSSAFLIFLSFIVGR